MTFSASDCGEGLICDGRGKVSNCTEILARWEPLLDGSICPSGTNNLKHCPRGSYCPDAVTKIPCTEGYFCPYKTKKPEIKCSMCDEGATELARDLYGYIVFIILGVIMFAYLCFKCIYEKKMKSKDNREKLEARLMNAKYEERQEKKQRKKNERLRPKINAIFDRVGIDRINEDEDCENAETIGKLFDALDVNNNSTMMYDELNIGMKLKDAQSKEFIRIMNKCAGRREDALTVGKDTFVKYFCATVEKSANYDPSPEECAGIFELIADQQTGNPLTTNINLNGLYDTELMFFLSYPQINEIIKALGYTPSSNAEERLIEEIVVTSTPSSDAEEGLIEEIAVTFTNNALRSKTIDKATFIEKYPSVLHHISSGRTFNKIPQGIDITFQSLSLHINTGGQLTPVVDNVSGRLKRNTMTALMGGSGAGKSSLLNALCGRAFYGEVSGSIMINGHETSIDNYLDVVGFVPQDDIVYAELTVRENLIYAGRFRLPKETSPQQIEDLADEVMANLGLARVADNIVGDVSRRGVSGGEKKRVNIGLELMSEPSILFLDEPTSGLDASSAMLVMKGLGNLVEKKGVTVCSVIHQPRKVIFELFDSLILLGVGGKMVYHGRVHEAEDYFSDIGFELPPGESVADWFIDISTGRLDAKEDEKGKSTKLGLGKSVLIHHSMIDEVNPLEEMEEADKEKDNCAKLYSHWKNHIDGLEVEKREKYEAPKQFALPTNRKRQPFVKQVIYHIERNSIVQKRNLYTKVMDTIIMVVVSVLICIFNGKLKLTRKVNPNWRNEYEVLTLDTSSTFFEDEKNVKQFISALYKFSLSNTDIIAYAQQITIVICTLIAIAACKMLLEKRLELFREAGSGYNLTAYYLALNISSAIEHTIQMIIIALPLIWLRCTVSSLLCLVLNFVMMGWVATSWSLVFPIIVPPRNVILSLSSFIVFFSVIFSGLLSPAKFKDIYSNKLIAFISGMFSSSRFFTETLLVSEARVLPPQTGWTLTDYIVPNTLSSYINEQLNIVTESDEMYVGRLNGFHIMQYAQQDLINSSTQSSSGWYYLMATPFFVGLTIRFGGVLLLHCCNRSQQARSSVLVELKGNVSYRFEIAGLFLLFLVCLFISLVQIFRK